MGRKTTFYEFTPATRAKWGMLARQVSAYANYVSGDDKEKIWSKDEVLGHIHTVMSELGEEMDKRKEGMYLERMRMASVFSGPDYPTLDLVSTEGNGFAYKWIRDGEIPAGFLGHILSIAGGMPRLAFDYFILLARKYNFDVLVEAIGATKAMTLLLLAELYVRVHRADDKIDEDRFEQYIISIEGFKSEVQSKITKAEAKGFNSMATSLLIGSGE